MAEIIEGLISAIGSFLAKLYPAWILADLILGGLSLLFVAATGGLAELIGGVAINAAIGAIPFPFNLIAVFYIAPIYLMLQIILFVIIFIVLESR
jgi:hypothetical protein